MANDCKCWGERTLSKEYPAWYYLAERTSFGHVLMMRVCNSTDAPLHFRCNGHPDDQRGKDCCVDILSTEEIYISGKEKHKPKYACLENLACCEATYVINWANVVESIVVFGNDLKNSGIKLLYRVRVIDSGKTVTLYGLTSSPISLSESDGSIDIEVEFDAPLKVKGDKGVAVAYTFLTRLFKS